MKNIKLPVYILAIALIFAACKAKKPVAAAPTTPETPPVQQAAPVTPPQAPPTDNPAPPPADYNFSNIQFEFNSGVLKTDSYPVLDKAVVEMKKDLSTRFLLVGNSSAEGTDQHNMELSVERANAVKTYLTNSGIQGDRLEVKGFGESKPIANNKTEEGRMLNRRVEIKKQ